MIGAPDRHTDATFFSIAAVLLRRRAALLRFALAGGLIAGLIVAGRPRLFVGSASFFSQPTDAGRSGLASLAGQFGVALSSGPSSVSPEFYSRLLKTNVLLVPIVSDTFTVDSASGQRRLFFDLFEVEGRNERRREDQAVRLLRGIIGTLVVRQTGAVEFTVRTPWPNVSLEITKRLLEGVNDFNRSTRQLQARDERIFIQGRREVAERELREAEDRLEGFLARNRSTLNSPQLLFERERLQRGVVTAQAVFTSLVQSFEEVRIREVRDTPLITTIEPPRVPVSPEPRRLLFWVVFGLLAGGGLGGLLAIGIDTTTRLKSEGDPGVAAAAKEWAVARAQLAAVGNLLASRVGWRRPQA